MKVRIQRFPPHQNAKMAGILMGLVAAVIIVPLSILMWAIRAHVQPSTPPPPHPPLSLFILLPLVYAVIGYLVTALWCALYNGLRRILGGFEFEADETE